MCRCFYHRVRLCLALFVTSWKKVVFFMCMIHPALEGVHNPFIQLMLS